MGIEFLQDFQAQMETWLLIVIIAASVLVVGALVWFLFLRKEEEEAAEAKVQIIDVNSETSITLAVDEVAYLYGAHEPVEDGEWIFGECEVAEIEVVTKADVPFPEEGEDEEGEEEEEDERRLRDGHGEDEEGE